jgi:hypothetical protein
VVTEISLVKALQTQSGSNRQEMRPAAGEAYDQHFKSNHLGLDSTGIGGDDTGSNFTDFNAASISLYTDWMSCHIT